MKLNIFSKCIITGNREIPLPLSDLYKLPESWGCNSHGRVLTSNGRDMVILKCDMRNLYENTEYGQVIEKIILRERDKEGMEKINSKIITLCI